MTEVELVADVRELIGNPTVNDVSNRQLRRYLINASEWLADQLEYHVVTDEQAVLLVANVLEYPLPDELCWVIFAEWNDLKLDANTTYGWEKEGSGWRSATASLPAQFAVQGRHLILNPPPSSDAITTDSYVALRYIATSAGISPGGPPQMGKMDQQALVFKAAHLYCIAHPGNTEHAARIGNYEKELAQRMKRALGRADNPIEDLQETFHVWTRRRGAAR